MFCFFLQNADTRKVADNLQQSAGESESEKSNLKREIEDLKKKLDEYLLAEQAMARKRLEEQKRLLGEAWCWRVNKSRFVWSECTPT